MRTRNWLMAAALVGLALVLPGCNTVRGVGKDVHDMAMNVQGWMEHSDRNYEYVDSRASADYRSARARP